MPIPPIPADGSLIVGATAPQVYLVEAQRRRWVPDPLTFEAMGFRWEDVQTFSDAEVNWVPLGAPLPALSRVQAHFDSDLGAGHFMTTDATLLSNGQLSAFTRTQTTTMFGGFTGGVTVLMAGANGVVIGASSQHTFGVDGRWVGVSDRTERWSEAIDPALAAQTTQIGVAHGWAPKVDTAAMVGRAIAAAQTIWELYQTLNQEQDSAGGG
jgi:hypothetical protein